MGKMDMCKMKQGMRGFTASVFLITVALGGKIVSAEQDKKPFTFCDWYIVETEYQPGIAVYSEASKDTEVLVRIKNGTHLPVYAYQDGYGYTIFDNEVGWINLKFTHEETETESTQSRQRADDSFRIFTTEYENDAEKVEWYIISDDYEKGIAMHPIPVKESEIIDRLTQYTVFPVFEHDGDYGKTYIFEKEGWTNLDYAIGIYKNGKIILDRNNLENETEGQTEKSQEEQGDTAPISKEDSDMFLKEYLEKQLQSEEGKEWECEDFKTADNESECYCYLVTTSQGKRKYTINKNTGVLCMQNASISSESEDPASITWAPSIKVGEMPH